MSLSQGHDTIARYIIKIQLGSNNLWSGHSYGYVCSDNDRGDMTLGQGHDTPLGHGQQLCEILSRSILAMRSYGPDMDFVYVCTVTLTLEIWPWVKVMTQLCEILSRSNLAVRSYGPDTDFLYMCTVTLALEIWPWVKVMTQLCEILSRSNLAVRSYGPDTDILYMCTVTLALEI